jgi:mycothiol system anti-sigma-R factor
MGEHDAAGSGVDCDEALHELYHYLDGELTDERRRGIAEHLERCAPCGSVAEFEAELKQLVHDSCATEVPADLRARLALALDEESRHGS